MTNPIESEPRSCPRKAVGMAPGVHHISAPLRRMNRFYLTYYLSVIPFRRQIALLKT